MKKPVTVVYLIQFDGVSEASLGRVASPIIKKMLKEMVRTRRKGLKEKICVRLAAYVMGEGKVI